LNDISNSERKATMETRKLFPLSGIAFVALILLSIVAVGGGTPSSGASAEEVASFYDENALRQFLSTFVLAASAPFIVLFGVSLASTSSSGWGRVVAAGAILVAAAVLVGAFVHMALVDGGDQKISPTALQALNSLDGNTWILMTSGLGVLMLGAAGVMLSSATRWLGWTALVLACALFIPFADFFAMMATAIWIVVVSVALARARTEATYVAAPDAT
jgi:hypothetical protein